MEIILQNITPRTQPQNRITHLPTKPNLILAERTRIRLVPSPPHAKIVIALLHLDLQIRDQVAFDASPDAQEIAAVFLGLAEGASAEELAWCFLLRGRHEGGAGRERWRG